VVSSTPRPYFTPGKTRYPLYRRLSGPQGRSGQVRKISPPLGFDPRTVQPVVSRYTDWTTRPTFMRVTYPNSMGERVRRRIRAYGVIKRHIRLNANMYDSVGLCCGFGYRPIHFNKWVTEGLQVINRSILGAFANWIRKMTKGFFTSVSAWNNVAPTRWICMKTDTVDSFLKFVYTFQFWLKPV
jgi:hypothetical protein